MAEERGVLTVLAAFAGFFLVLFMVFKVLDLEFFRGDPDLGGSALPATDGKAREALTHCAEAALTRVPAKPGPGRSLPEFTAWNLGFDRYLVKGTITGGDGAVTPYLCRILDQGEGRWTVQSIEMMH